jgi:hypothetical protein
MAGKIQAYSFTLSVLGVNDRFYAKNRHLTGI